MASPSELSCGSDRLISPEELEAKVALGRPLRVKFGIDPTAPDLHLGHMVPLLHLRRFQAAGHLAVLLVGDFTARIGDPSGRNDTRPPLSPDTIKAHTDTYLAQVYRLLDPARTEVAFNGTWLTPLLASTAENSQNTLLGLLARHTVQQLTEREDFKQRLAQGAPLTLLELLYPLLQGYDSCALRADVELGGTDQLFNLLMGRRLQTEQGQTPQVVMTFPLLEGTDGVRKMSKSYGNVIAFNDPPQEVFGKVMSLSDDMMLKYYTLLTDEKLDRVKTLHPREAKMNLASLLTGRLHSPQKAEEARAHFERVFSSRAEPESVPLHHLSKPTGRLTDFLVESGLAPSRKEAQRLIQQGAVDVAGNRVSEDQEITFSTPTLVKVGKRRFGRLCPPGQRP